MIVDTTLWHITVSHYSEKVRWALDFKDVPHERRAPMPGAHMAVALWRTRGAAFTFPLLRLDGRTYSDSTEILAAIEEHFPQPPLYPETPAELDRALELEDFFDEEAGPYTRLFAFHELRSDPKGLEQFATAVLPERLVADDRTLAVSARIAGAFSQVRYRVDAAEAAATAREKIMVAFDRLEAELDEGEGRYLVGDRFTVADLTAAALLAPTVAPATAPDYPDATGGVAELRDGLRDRPGFAWVEEMFRCHRQNPRRP